MITHTDEIREAFLKIVFERLNKSGDTLVYWRLFSNDNILLYEIPIKEVYLIDNFQIGMRPVTHSFKALASGYYTYNELRNRKSELVLKGGYGDIFLDKRRIYSGDPLTLSQLVTYRAAE